MEDRVTQKSKSPRQRRSIFFPLLLVGIGVLLLLHTLRVLPGSAWGTILRYWPVLFIASALDSIYRGEGYVGAVIWGGIGAFLLLNNLGMLPNASWTMLLRWWPVLLIAVGLDLIIGRHSVWSAVIGIVLGLVILAGIVWLSVGLSPVVDVATETTLYPLENAETIQAYLSATAGDVKVSSGAEPANAVEAAITKTSNEDIDMSYDVRENKGYFDLENKGFFVLYPAFQNPSAKSAWEIFFNEETPLVLESDLIAGQQELDLRSLQVRRLDSKTIFGRSVIMLPNEESFDGDVEVIFGEMLLYVPDDAAVCIYADTGLTGLDLPEGYTQENGLILSPGAEEGEGCMEMDVNLPIGSLRIITD